MSKSQFPREIHDSLQLALSVLPEHFHRKRGRLGPRNLLYMLVSMAAIGNRSYAGMISNLREALADEAWDVTTSALCQARRKFDSTMCKDAFVAIRDSFGEARAMDSELFYGLRVCAIDGTKLSLPVSDELMEDFGSPVNQHGEPAPCPQASLISVWDVSNNQPIDWSLGRWDDSERNASFNLIDALGSGDLLLADRGYPSLDFFHHLLDRHIDFIIRANTTTVAIPKELREFLSSDATDRIVTIHPQGNKVKRFKGDAPMEVRYVRDARGRVFATSLLDPAVSVEEISNTYCRRWNIETAFRESKQWQGLEEFIALFSDGIHQEVSAIMILQYLVGELEAEMRKRVLERVAEGLEPESAIDECPYTFNRKFLTDRVIHILKKFRMGKDVKVEWDWTVRMLWKHRNRKRRNRSYPRRSKSPHGKSRKTGPYKTRR